MIATNPNAADDSAAGRVQVESHPICDVAHCDPRFRATSRSPQMPDISVRQKLKTLIVSTQNPVDY